MKQKLTIIIISAVLVILIAIIAGIYVVREIKENEKIDREAVTLKSDLTIEFGQKAKVSDFIENLNGRYINDYDIDTEHLGNIKVTFEYINIKNKKRNYTFEITTKDVTAPKIYCGGSYTLKVGDNKNLTDVLLSGDNIDDNPKREIIGEYDFNTIGNYDLTYVVTDSSGNKTSKQIVLRVVEEISKTESSTGKEVYIEDAINNYKTENTKIGIDVSKWQGKINWEEVENSGVEFAMIRIGYQKDYDAECVIDPYFIENIENAISLRNTSRWIFSLICKNTKPSNRTSRMGKRTNLKVQYFTSNCFRLGKLEFI